MNAKLQEWQANVEKNKTPFRFATSQANRPTTRAGRKRGFTHLDPVVREKAESLYHDLQVKHRVKGTPKRILVATAIRLAKQFYGLIPPSQWGRKASDRDRNIKGLRTKLGLNQSTPTLTEACEVGQANLDGI